MYLPPPTLSNPPTLKLVRGQAIEGNGMTIRGWSEVMDQMASDGKITQKELARGMRLLELHGGRRKQVVLTPDKVRETPTLRICPG